MRASVCTPDEWAWLEEKRPSTSIIDLLDEFEAKFGHRPNKATVIAHMSDKGIKRDIQRVKWTPEMDEYFAQITPGHMEHEIRAMFSERYGIVLTEAQIAGQKRKLGVKSGTKGGCFKKGQVPQNKGKTWDEIGLSPETQARMRATCFKKGILPHNAVDNPVGTERTTRDGYIEVKVAERPTRHNRNDNWRMKHHIEWEKANGKPVPKSTMIIFADHDKSNFDPNNLVAIPRSLWVRISQIRVPYWDRESLETAVIRARLATARFAAEKHRRPCKKCGRYFSPNHPKRKTCDACLGREAE